MMADVPKVTITPTEGMGFPMINGHQVDAIAELYLYGGVHDPQESLGLSRHEVIVACWYWAKHGTPIYTERWQLWARYVDIELRRGDLGVDELPLPPRLMKTTDPGE